MTRIVYNACYGGFGLSDAAIKRYADIAGFKLYPVRENHGLITYWRRPGGQPKEILEGSRWANATDGERAASNQIYRDNVFYDRDLERTDPILVQVVEELGDAANGHCAKLRVADIPAGTRYRIDEYDGNESVETVSSYEWKTA